MNISSVKKCSGCLACLDRCPKSCISIRKDKLGHIQPYISENECIDCSLCLKVCPAENTPSFHEPLSTWAAWRKEEEARMESSSGGLASVLSEAIVKEGGVVYGCAFQPKFEFKHIRCTSVEELQLLKGSKYVQSDTRGVYTSIAKDLKGNKKVLFIGTPCQVAGVKRFFAGKDNNLYAIDLICHGVPSVEMLKDSLPEGIWGHDFDQVEFRACTKFHFSAKSGISTVFDRPLHKDLFLKGFFTALFYRNSCYTCNYAQKKRVGDITLGDFWGVNTNEVRTDVGKGVSLCMVNSQKGKELFDSVSGHIEKMERSIGEAVAGNKQLSHPMPRSFRAKIFRVLYPQCGFKWSIIASIPEIIIKNKLLKR